MSPMKRLYRHIPTGLRRLSISGNLLKSVPQTIAVAMSGGIDSAVAALLLKDQGHKVVGIFMKNWDPADECGNETCDLDSDHKDMQEVCARLDIPAYDVKFVKEYWNEVFSPFLEAYQAGVETPNPDAFCNRHVKFKHLLSFVNNKLGIDKIATGHYSRTIHAGDEDGVKPSVAESGQVRLLKGVDPLKDQSYFLALTKGEALQRVVLPIGHLTKEQVKAIAAARLPGLRVLSKHESMGICFIGKRDMKEFLQDYITLTPGRFIDLDTDKVVGTHAAFEYYTVGQKARISGTLHKYYVVGRKKNTLVAATGATAKILIAADGDDASKGTEIGIDRSSTTTGDRTSRLDSGAVASIGSSAEESSVSGDVYVVSGSEHPSLYSPYIVQPLSSLNWIAGGAPLALRVLIEQHSGAVESDKNSHQQQQQQQQGYRCECKCRYSQLPTPCTIQVLSGSSSSSAGVEGSKENRAVMLKITFDIPQRAITAGQIIALYDGEECLGGGVIAEQPLFVGEDKAPLYL